jgi:hypothetical protein
MIQGIVRYFRDYSSRHRNPWNRLCHIIGVPLVFWSIYVLFRQRYLTGGLAFFGGFGLQGLGHHLERNEMGEWIAIKWLYGRLSGRQDHEQGGSRVGDGGDWLLGSSPGGEPGKLRGNHPDAGPRVQSGGAPERAGM